jgi:hypothetical protein
VSGTYEEILPLLHKQFTAMVNCGAILLRKWTYALNKSKRRERKSTSAESASVRATISFASDVYKALEEIAREKKVSVAWVVRDATEQYVAGKWPLFKRRP